PLFRSDAAERLHADQRSAWRAFPREARERARRRAGADSADERHRVRVEFTTDPIRDGAVAEPVDLVVILPHPVDPRIVAQDLAYPLHSPTLVELQVLRRLHLLQPGAEHLELGADGPVDGRGAHDVAPQPVSMAGQGERVRVDPAGAVQQRVTGPDPVRVEEMT